MNVNPSLFVIMIELLAVESLVLVVISALYIKHRYQCKIVFQNVINATEATENARQQVLETTLRDLVKEGEEDTSGFAARLVEAENRFHKKLLTTFIKQDHEGLSRLGKWTEELLSPYRTLISETAATSKQEKEQLDKKVSELEHTTESLTAEKTQLNQQLDETKGNLDNIMSEYVSAFKKGEAPSEGNGNPDGTAAAVDNTSTPASTAESPDEGIMVASAEEEDDNPAPVVEENTNHLSDDESITIAVENDEQPETKNSADDELLKVEDLDEAAAEVPDPSAEASPGTEDSSENQGSDAILDDVDMGPTTSGDKTAAA